MFRRACKIAVTLLALVSANAAPARACPIQPDFDATINVPWGQIGVQTYGDSSYLLLGRQNVDLGRRGVAAGAALPIAFAGASLAVARGRRRRLVERPV